MTTLAAEPGASVLAAFHRAPASGDSARADSWPAAARPGHVPASGRAVRAAQAARVALERAAL